MSYWPTGTPSNSQNLWADPASEHEYLEAGFWGTETLSDIVARHAGGAKRDAPAFIETDRHWSWRGYHLLSALLAEKFAEAGLERTDRVVVFLPDSGLLHGVYLAAERAGLIVVGVGYRAGLAELSHLVGRCQAVAFVSLEDGGSEIFKELQAQRPRLRYHFQVDEILEDSLDQQSETPLVTGLSVALNGGSAEVLNADFEVSASEMPASTSPEAATTAFQYARFQREFPDRLGPSELFLLNSTSGTTGLPKCVMQTQNRWFYFHQLAETYGALTSDDRFCVAVPAPFGFGLWTTHFTPAVLVCPTILMRKFSAELLLSLLEREKATVLCAVTTQFIMMLNTLEMSSREVSYNLSSLRVLFTGGEAIPPQRAQEFERQTGAALLNFYGSNETGVLTGTKITDPQNVRISTGGRPVPEMNVRLLHPDTHEVIWQDTATQVPAPATSQEATPATPETATLNGVPACKGPATTLGYYDDDPANTELFTEDGWMLMGDIVRLEDGCLQVVGRTSDFIIRGGKNISAPAVEAEVMTHEAVHLAAAVPAPDEVFGERVAVYVELREGANLELPELCEHLESRGVSKEWLPEHLVVVDNIPRSSGAKVAKSELAEDIARKLAAHQQSPV